MADYKSELHEVMVARFDNDTVAEMLIEILEDNGIPVHKVYQGLGEASLIYLGMSQTGVELHVREDQLKQAKQIILQFNHYELTDEHLSEE
jgi:hypothetical protein